MTEADWTQLRARGTIHEDEVCLVLNKPAGLSVMGERHDTDLVRLAAEAGETLYPAHRIDKVTSGAILLAKELAAHGDLTRQFNKRTVGKSYLAITAATGLPAEGTIELPLSVGRKNRVRVAAPRESIAEHGGVWSVPDGDVFTHVKSYPSVTGFKRLWEGEGRTLLSVRPETGRRHQIRVHLAWIGFPIVGDPLFDKAAGGRTGLHSWRLAFDAAGEPGRRVEVAAEPGADFLALAGAEVPAEVFAEV
ncbi:RNA pseudouridine synthase [Phytomonospora sp. NPDC050363]|uniref:RluA family pseudouridine synthase n=1 Tax=Phytomonospora sp. NPDC050363 TaxID=3155642 RepID=UPI00340814AD